MAMNSLRRALSFSPTILRHTRLTSTPLAAIAIAIAIETNSTLANPNRNLGATVRHFHSTHPVSFSSASRSFNEIDKIDPDTILFEGCDYKHWLIVMDFGRDPNQRPPPDQMVDTYVQTCAKVLGSVEEAKKRIYACSTTTYTGFQVEVDEETSKKFEGLPGVIFVLPDSYIDPVNKEYGGDKYNNGEITPRPPPVQYGRTRRPVRPTDQRPRFPSNQQGNPASYNQQGNPSYNQQGIPGYNQQGNPAFNQQGNPVYSQQGSPAYNQHASAPGDGRGFTPQGSQQGFPQQQGFPPQQNYPPKQNYGSSSPAYTGNSMPSGTNHPGVGRDGYQSGSNFVPPQQGNYNHGYNHPLGQTNNHPGNLGGYAPPGQFRSDAGSYGHNHPQGQGGHRPGDHGGYAPPGQIGFFGDTRVNSQSPGMGGYEQRRPGSFEQSGAGLYGEEPSGSYGRNAGAGYPPPGGHQMIPLTSNEQSDPMQQRNYLPGTQTGFNQGRY